MNKLGLSVLICALCATAACSRLREPTDAQLAALLVVERSAPADANVQLDGNVIDCMRAWSNDSELLKGLPMRVAGEDGQKTCHTKIDGVLADTARNPDKFAFQDVTAPKVVRRAVALQEARRQAALTDPARRQAPPAFTGHLPQPAPSSLAAPDPTLKLGVAGNELEEAESLCQQTQQAAAEPDANDRLKRFASGCAGTMRRLRMTVQQAARIGRSGADLTAITVSANAMAANAREVLALGKQQ